MDSMVSAYKEMWSRWSDFSGRSSVGKYWWSVLLNWLIIIAAIVVGAILGAISSTLGSIVSIALGIYGLATIVPFLSLAIRRLHDTGRSGWFLLISLIPFVGGIIVIVFLAGAGDPAPNQYGQAEWSGAINP